MYLDMFGVGSAFNSDELGNNSGFFTNNNDVYLIDCGPDVYLKVIREGLHEYKNFNIIITHLHNDRVGSLGTLIEFMYYTMKTKVKIISHSKININGHLSILGIDPSMYSYIANIDDVSHYHKDNIEIKFFEVDHVHNLNSYGFTIYDDDKMIIYSGETKESPEDIIGKAKVSRSVKEITLYMDLSVNNSPVHFSDMSKLKRDIDKYPYVEFMFMYLDGGIMDYLEAFEEYDISEVNICIPIDIELSE